MFGTSLVVENDILDIGSSKFDRGNGSRATGSGGICPPSLVLGEPGQFDVPNVADVRFSTPNIWFHINSILLKNSRFPWP